MSDTWALLMAQMAKYPWGLMGTLTVPSSPWLISQRRKLRPREDRNISCTWLQLPAHAAADLLDSAQPLTLGLSAWSLGCRLSQHLPQWTQGIPGDLKGSGACRKESGQGHLRGPQEVVAESHTGAGGPAALIPPWGPGTRMGTITPQLGERRRIPLLSWMSNSHLNPSSAWASVSYSHM